MAEHSRDDAGAPPDAVGPFASSWRRRHLTVDERVARGEAARQGRDHDDPLFLQVKEAQPSVLERFLGASTYPHHGERVVAGQRLMQAATDIFLGWQRIKGLDGVTRDYYVRQFHDWKGSADRIAIASYLGKGDAFDRAMADFSAAYADQNERDYRAFAAAVDSGRLVARTGV
jgi:Uncharacterized protein conserved in bacteria (DUF2252)